MTRPFLTTTRVLTTACALWLAQAVVAATTSPTKSIAPSQAPSKPGTTVTTKDRSVSFWMPATPTQSAGVMKEGAPVHWTRYATDDRGYAISTGIFESSGLPVTGHEEWVLDRTVSNTLKNLGPKTILDKDDGRTELQLGSQKLKGVQLKWTERDIQTLWRTYVGACRTYLFQITYAVNDKAAKQVADRYFKSVTIQDPITEICAPNLQ